ncbi:NAD(P)/FAD-dependent oxidoreductase [Methylobacterium sp. PvR107]|uniref:FAD-dependent oxidoreductase n=1 Tax=Methylobacterium sp. PvR107 TaxID=2806597 RepID=UPI001AE7F287|nr:NAD(P)/FAD-dependent oxidoreductase [Methylobacterium sp. PvR107]
MTTCGNLRDGGTVAIVGAGPGGATLARLLDRRGYTVRVLERDASPDGRHQGGSLDLRPDSGQRAIGAAALAETFAERSRDDAKAFRMLDADGHEMPGQGQETHEDAGPEIDRGDLRAMLIEALPSGMVAWDHNVEVVERQLDGKWRLRIEGRDAVTADLVVGADGIGSRVRAALTNVQPIYTGITMVAAYIRPELWRGSRISDTLGEGSVMFAGANKTIFVQRCARDVILLYYSLAVPEGWPKCAGFDLSDTGAVMAAVRETFRDWSPRILGMLTDVQDRFQVWPTSVMPPDYRWDSKPGLTMLGDASHVMPPFTGKGVNLALLDALDLADALVANPGRAVADAIAGFERDMQARTSQEIRACLQVGRSAYGIDLGFDLGKPA